MSDRDLYRAAARAKKAYRLANTIRANGGTLLVAVALPADGRRMAEQVAGVSESSDETWSMVFGILEVMEA